MLFYQTDSMFLSSLGKKGVLKHLSRIKIKMTPDNFFFPNNSIFSPSYRN